MHIHVWKSICVLEWMLKSNDLSMLFRLLVGELLNPKVPSCFYWLRYQERTKYSGGAKSLRKRLVQGILVCVDGGRWGHWILLNKLYIYYMGVVYYLYYILIYHININKFNQMCSYINKLDVLKYYISCININKLNWMLFHNAFSSPTTWIPTLTLTVWSLEPQHW